MIAALYVQPDGVYYGIPDVDPWGPPRDAREYPGPWSVVAHPPCARWCRLAKFVESRRPHLRVGDDGGTFAAALTAVRKWGGVLEHPAWSMAWAAHGLTAPTRGGWTRTIDGSWVCEVSQRAYGHPCTKLTWLLYAGERSPPGLDWSRPKPVGTISSCTRRGDGTIWWGKALNGLVEVSKRRASATPLAFRDLLLDIARSARPRVDGAC